jgi:hypothetical protein
MSDADQSEVIAFLSVPANLGAGPVTRIDTHASVVFLAGDRAYKLKRAVKYSYLDYSTVELRRMHCEAELRLNRRTAPSLYLEVQPISRRKNGTLGFGPEGMVQDWVVVMRRFDQDGLLDHRADRGDLTSVLILELADSVAAFHADAARVLDAGGVSGMAEVVDGNTLNLRAAVPNHFKSKEVEQVVVATNARLNQLSQLLENRRKGGHVRQCHGDLHLRNVCLIDGHPTLFDCIEFSRSIACIDVLYDLAFLLMDLWDRDLGTLANAAFNRYFDLRNEIDGISALPFFMSVRAAVRAHVGVATAERQQEIAEKSRQVDEARRYLSLAHGLLQSKAPRLIAIGGLSGSGKSTLAYGLAPALGVAPGARVLRSDVIRKRLMGVTLTERLPEEAYGEEVTQRVYDRMTSEATLALLAGHSVIADAVFARPEQRNTIAELARRNTAMFSALWLQAPPDVMTRRLRRRRGDASDATPEVLARQLGYDLGKIEWEVIAAGANPAEVLTEARRRLSLR